jgi:hypothetical protein
MQSGSLNEWAVVNEERQTAFADEAIERFRL